MLRETIAVATFEGGDYKIHILAFGEGGHYILVPRKTLIATGEVTSMHIDPWHGLLAALTINGRPYLARNSVEYSSTALELIDLETGTCLQCHIQEARADLCRACFGS